jgi:hypothetical protein
MVLFAQVAAKGKQAAFDRDNFGCFGGGVGLGFGRQYDKFPPGGIDAFKYFLSTGLEGQGRDDLVGKRGGSTLEKAGGYSIEVLLGLFRDPAQCRSLGFGFNDPCYLSVHEKKVICTPGIERELTYSNAPGDSGIMSIPILDGPAGIHKELVDLSSRHLFRCSLLQSRLNHPHPKSLWSNQVVYRNRVGLAISDHMGSMRRSIVSDLLS